MFPTVYFILYFNNIPMFQFSFRTTDYDKAYLWMEGYCTGLNENFRFDDVHSEYKNNLLNVTPW